MGVIFMKFIYCGKFGLKYKVTVCAMGVIWLFFIFPPAPTNNKRSQLLSLLHRLTR